MHLLVLRVYGAYGACVRMRFAGARTHARMFVCVCVCYKKHVYICGRVQRSLQRATFSFVRVLSAVYASFTAPRVLRARCL